MKLVVTVLLFLFNVPAEKADVKRIRDLFKDALYKEAKAAELLSYLGKAENIPMTIGYKGAAAMLLSKYSINPFNKFKYFKEGKTFLEQAIAEDSTSAELRYLRFSFQTNIPDFLEYNSCLEKDKMFLLNAVMNISDLELKNNITTLLKNSKYVTENEKHKI